MEKEPSLTKIGSTVNINLKKINENITTDLKNQLLKNPYGKVVGYKITDGVGLGLIIELSNGEKFWFFDPDLKSILFDWLWIIDIAEAIALKYWELDFSDNLTNGLFNRLFFKILYLICIK